MKNILFTSIFLCIIAIGFSQENTYSKSFMEKYISLSKEDNKGLNEDKYLNLVEKNKLNSVFVYAIYAENFPPSEVDASINALLLAFVLEYEMLKNDKFYLHKENDISVKASEIYMEKWKLFSKDKKQSESLFTSFINAEQKRLLTVGVDVKLLLQYFKTKR